MKAPVAQVADAAKLMAPGGTLVFTSSSAVYAETDGSAPSSPSALPSLPPSCG